MKTASKVFIIISLVIVSIYAFCALVVSIAFNSPAIGAMILIVIYYPIFLLIAIKALEKLKTAETHEDLVAMGVMVMIFCSFLGGLFMLLIKDEELKYNKEIENSKNWSFSSALKRISDNRAKNNISSHYNVSKTYNPYGTPNVIAATSINNASKTFTTSKSLNHENKSATQSTKLNLKITHCSKCGEKIEEGQNFCGKCGASLINKCLKCNTINKPDNLFCSNCGVKLKEQ